MNSIEDASAGTGNVSAAPETSGAAAADDGPALPPELIRMVLAELDAKHCKRTILDICTADTEAPAFFSSARKHASLVRELDLRSGKSSESRVTACLALFDDLHSLRVRAVGDWDDVAWKLIPGLENLELLQIYFMPFTSRELRLALPAGLRSLQLETEFPRDAAAFAAALEPLTSLIVFDLDTYGLFEGAFDPLLPLNHVVSALRTLGLRSNDLHHADGLFRSPDFQPWAIKIDFRVVEIPWIIPGSLSALSGLGELHLTFGATSVILVPGLPPAQTLSIHYFNASLPEPDLGGVEAMLRSKYSAIVLQGLRTHGRHADVAEVAMWRRITDGNLQVVDVEFG
ncbi:hypothetical protein DFJ74DRAFT_705219 [Hyaloraphidium curvatum]|nr:hypothetical protein DFJ74DRAFT_705219 [Hyaloraphidium curvatum]